jgi:hypothetical protein
MTTQRVNGSITVQYPNIGFTLERFYSGVEVYHGTARTCTTARQRFIAEKVMAAVERVLEEEDFTDDEAEAAYWEFENGGEEDDPYQIIPQLTGEDFKIIVPVNNSAMEAYWADFNKRVSNKIDAQLREALGK